MLADALGAAYAPGQQGFPPGHPMAMQMRMQGPPPGMAPPMVQGHVQPEKRLTLFVGKIKRGVGDDLMRALLKVRHLLGSSMQSLWV